MWNKPLALILPSLIGVLLSGNPAYAGTETGPEVVSFSEAWQRVLTHNDGLAAEKSNLDKAANMREAATSLYLPKVSIGANYTRLDDDIELEPHQLTGAMPNLPNGLDSALGNILAGLGLPAMDLNHTFTTRIEDKEVFTSSIKAIWPIFTGGRINAMQDIAAGKESEAKSLLAMKQQALFEELTKRYFAAVLAKHVVETRQEVESGLLQHLEHARKLEQQGQIAKVERLQAEVAYDKAKVDAQKAQRDLEIVRAALREMVNSQGGISLSSELFTDVPLNGMQKYISQTLASYPGLSLLDAKKHQAEGMIDAEQGAYLPNVYAYGNYNLHDSDSLASELAPDWMVGVGVSLPLIDNSGRSGKVAAAKSAVRQVNHLRAQAEKDLTVLVEKTFREANQAIEEYQGLSSSLSLANENLLLRQKAFSQGLSTSLDVVDAEMYLAGVKTQRLAAAYQYVISLSRLQALTSKYQPAAFDRHSVPSQPFTQEKQNHG
ncbi:TolC family protein [Parasalinivibrio latis]|uniref:TolC family protein n=1 Tax=Parasalinivibrio latis TaxID=2952610 RepID=UPI0030E12A64